MKLNNTDNRQTSALSQEIADKIKELRAVDYRDITKIALLKEYVQ